MTMDHDVGSTDGGGRRDLLKKAAVAGVALWVAPAVISVEAASAASAPPGQPTAGCVRFEGQLCLPQVGFLSLYRVTNGCGAPVFVLRPGEVLDDGASTNITVDPGGNAISLFAVDGRGQPMGPPFDTVQLPSLC